jgi:hypothetical protein
MEFAACDGSLSVGSGGEILCAGNWVFIEDGVTLTLAELAPADLAALLAAALVTLALAFGLRVIRKQMGF